MWKKILNLWWKKKSFHFWQQTSADAAYIYFLCLIKNIFDKFLSEFNWCNSFVICWNLTQLPQFEACFCSIFSNTINASFVSSQTNYKGIFTKMRSYLNKKLRMENFLLVSSSSSLHNRKGWRKKCSPYTSCQKFSSF